VRVEPTEAIDLDPLQLFLQDISKVSLLKAA